MVSYSLFVGNSLINLQSSKPAPTRQLTAA